MGFEEGSIQSAARRWRTVDRLPWSELGTRDTADQKILQAKLESKEEQLKVVEERLEKEEKKINSTWHAVGGFILGVAATVLIVFATNGAKNTTK